jgi:hypothetical protein
MVINAHLLMDSGKEDHRYRYGVYELWVIEE